MDARRLEALVAVAREGSFTRAALALHLSQSGVSQQVAALERELGARLLDRARRRVVPTPAGAALLDWSERLLRDAEGARRAVAAAEGRVGGTLAIASSLTVAGYVLPRPLARLVELHPDLRPSVVVANTERVVRLLLSGAADLGFVEGDVSADGVELRSVGSDELVVIAPAGHPFERLDEVTVDELAAEPFVARERGSGTRQIAEATLARLGAPPLRTVAELSGIDAIKAAVEAGLGVAIVSALTVRRELRAGTLVARPLAGTTIRRELSAAFAAGQPVLPAARELLHLLA